MNDGYVNISAEKLKEVCVQCLKNRFYYSGEYDVDVKCQNSILARMTGKPKEYTIKSQPRWTYKDCGIDTKLMNLISVADNVLNDTNISDKDIKLSLTMYSELFKLLNKDEDFQPYIFGR